MAKKKKSKKQIDKWARLTKKDVTIIKKTKKG